MMIGDKRHFKLKMKLKSPWLILVRICASSIPKPLKVKNIRIKNIDKTKILILWKEYEYSNNERCVRTYEIYYAPLAPENNLNSRTLNWVWFDIYDIYIY